MTKQELRLTLLRWAARLGPSPVQPAEWPPRSVLLIRPDHLGDVLFTRPALQSLREGWPQTHLTLLVGPWAKAVAEGLSGPDAILTCPFPWFGRRPRGWLLEPYMSLLSQAGRLRAHRFDLAVILRFDHWWGAWLAQRAGIPRCVGYDVAEVAPFLTQAVPYQRGRHEVVQNLGLIEAVLGHGQSGGQPQGAAPTGLTFHPSDEDRGAAAALLAAEGLGLEDRLVAVHPGAGALVKLWHNTGWAQVIEALRAQYGLKAVLTGGQEERDLVADLSRRLSVPAVNLAGRTPLGQLAAVLGRCRLVLGVDSGPLHLAVAMGTPTIHLFGPVDPRLFGPWGDPGCHVVLTSERSCVPCNRLDYPVGELAAHPCVREIAVEQVLEAARKLLVQQCDD